MWVGSGCPSIVIYGILLVLARQLTLVFAGCAIQPDANGHVDQCDPEDPGNNDGNITAVQSENMKLDT